MPFLVNKVSYSLRYTRPLLPSEVAVETQGRGGGQGRTEEGIREGCQEEARVATVGLAGEAGALQPPREGLERFRFYTEGNRNPFRVRNILSKRVTQSDRMVVSEPSSVRQVCDPMPSAGLGNGVGKSRTMPLSCQGPWLPLFLRPSLTLVLRLYGPFKYSIENSSFS